MKHRLLCTQQRTSVLLVFISAVLALVALSIPTKSAEAATAKIVNGTFSYAMKEIYDQNPDISRMQLIRAGMRVGRDMMGTDSNTLILAFAGSSVSMLIMDYAYHLPYLQIINSNNIGIALMQGLSGRFGIG